MVEVKKLDPAVADKIGVLIQKKGVLDLVEELEGSELSQNKNVAVKTYLMFEKIPWEFLKKSKLSVWTIVVDGIKVHGEVHFDENSNWDISVLMEI